MIKFITNSLVSCMVTLILVSILLFVFMEAGAGKIAVKKLGIYATQEQYASFNSQLGLNEPAVIRYFDWLIGNDWRAGKKSGLKIVSLKDPESDEATWWAMYRGVPTRWVMDNSKMFQITRQADGRTLKTEAKNISWTTQQAADDKTNRFFWGVDENGNAVKWVQGAGEATWVLRAGGLQKMGDGPSQYIPLRKGLFRGDPGKSIQYNRPVITTLLNRIKNSFILAGVAFIVIMPTALLLGIIAGVFSGKWIDRIISFFSLAAAATPDYVSGLFLIIVLGIWGKVVPPVSVFLSDDAIFQNPSCLVLPVLTLTAVELGYIIRITRSSLVEIMGAPYIRTAIVKGMPEWRVIFVHAVRNALIAPVTVIMLHANWLIGGLVVTEVLFGFPGLGTYIYDAAIFGDFNAVSAAAMVTIFFAVLTRFIGDFSYILLNPRIRYK